MAPYRRRTAARRRARTRRAARSRSARRRPGRGCAAANRAGPDAGLLRGSPTAIRHAQASGGGWMLAVIGPRREHVVGEARAPRSGLFQKIVWPMNPSSRGAASSDSAPRECSRRIAPPGDRGKAGVPVPLPGVVAGREGVAERVSVARTDPSRQFWRRTDSQRPRISSRSDSANIRWASATDGREADVPAHGGLRAPTILASPARGRVAAPRGAGRPAAAPCERCRRGGCGRARVAGAQAFLEGGRRPRPSSRARPGRRSRPARSRSVLDFGCGPGRVLPHVAALALMAGARAATSTRRRSTGRPAAPGTGVVADLVSAALPYRGRPL